jgi:DNA-binding PadR family transcriptional regulator
MTPMADRDVPLVSDLAFHVLLALGNGPSHGYAIGRDVEEQSEGRTNAPRDVDPRRRYFALTDRGRLAVAAEARRLDALVRAARKRRLYPQRA